MKDAQKLERRDTCTPVDIPHVRSSVACTLNSPSGVMGSDAGLKTLSNSSDAALTGRERPGRDLRVPVVYVLNMRGRALMPTSPCKARHLIKQGKARVVERTPFTIQLLYATGEATQDVTLGVDAGYKSIGLSATTESKELYSAEIALRNDMVKLNSERRMYRRSRRGRKCWHRKPRFLNRAKPEGNLQLTDMMTYMYYCDIIYT